MRDAGTQVSNLDVAVSVIDTGTQADETRLIAVAVIRCFWSRGWIEASIPSPNPKAYLWESQAVLVLDSTDTANEVNLLLNKASLWKSQAVFVLDSTFV